MSESQLRRLIDERARSTPEASYLLDARNERRVTFGQLRDLTAAWGAHLDSAAIRPGATVLIDRSDPLDFAVVFLAVIAAGRCAVPVDPKAPSGEKARTRSMVGAALVVSDGDEVDGSAANGGSDPALAAGTLRLHTSGSTGEPKAVNLTEAQLLHVAAQIARHNQLSPGDRGYNPLPLFHINGEVVGVLASLIAGSALILDTRFQRRGFWDLMEQQEVTWINAVPAILAILAQEDLPARPRSLRFIRSASAPLSASVRQRFTAEYGPILVESYGMTEAGSQITATALPPAHSPIGSVGRPVGVELQVRPDSESDHSLEPGAVGRIWLRGTGVITGYVDGRAAERFDANGWLDTGDLGHLDEQGNLFHVGRADDVINRGGELVHPREIEEVLLGDPRVTEAVVVGRFDEVLGEVPVAYVITSEPDGTGQLAADLQGRCERELSRFKRPAQLIFVDDLPRAATGKILRNAVQTTTAVNA
jgi:acyl-CoA synthetase (AMP-forming)/AMP-acid ligase II